MWVSSSLVATLIRVSSAADVLGLVFTVNVARVYLASHMMMSENLKDKNML